MSTFMEGEVHTPSSPAGGATIDLNPPAGSAAVDLTGGIHLLPCSIKLDSPCQVSHYFKPKHTGVVADGLEVEEAFFRGRKLQGVSAPIPHGYRGYVLEKKKSDEGKSGETVEGEFSSWASRAEFRSLTYWNHDSFPSVDDPLLRCFHWFPVANALHKPISEEEMALASPPQAK